MISLIFTQNDMPVSKLIRSAMGSVCSHFAIIIDEKVVFHSNFKGAHVEFIQTFEKQSRIVYQIDLLLTFAEEELIYEECIKYDGDSYDWGAFAYLIYSYLKKKLFKSPMPTENPWGHKGWLMCVELANVLNVIGINIPHLDAFEPEKLYSNLRFLLAQRGMIKDVKNWPAQS